MDGSDSEVPSRRAPAESDWPVCADLDARTLPDDRLPSWSGLVHQIIRTGSRRGGFVLSGWECSCGECERPRYADPEMAAGAAQRHLARAS